MRRFYAFSLMVVAGLTINLVSTNLPLIEGLNSLIGSGLAFYVFFVTLMRTLSPARALVAIGWVALLYGFVLQFFFQEATAAYLTELTKVFDQSFASMEKTLQPDERQRLMLKDLAGSFRFMIGHYYFSVFGALLVIFAWLGQLLLARKIIFPINNAHLRMPDYLVWGLIIGLGAVWVPGLRTFGVNLMILLSAFYLIQGLAVIEFHWKRFMIRSRLFTIVLVVALLTNQFMLLLVVAMGLADFWFDFRKIVYMKETK